MITIIDYGMGNLASIKNMLKKIGVQSQITSSPSTIEKATKIILPGVGAFDNAIVNINKLGLLQVLDQKAKVEKVPILGICLGMQLLMNKSEEGTLPGLGWIDGEVKRFNFDERAVKLKVPHMGWNMTYSRSQESLFRNLDEARFYYVHSYYVKCRNEENILATSRYGDDFVSSVHSSNIFGTQFHPEKSHRFGMQLLKNFTDLI